MKIILVNDIYNLGQGGDVLDVADGYARNYLIPQKKAILATPYNLAKVKKISDEAKIVRLEKENKFKAVCEKLKKIDLEFVRKADSAGHLFGSVSEQNIADALVEKNIDVHHSHIKMESHLKELGNTEILIAFTTEISEKIIINVVSEDEKKKKTPKVEEKIEEVQVEETETEEQQED